MSDFIGIVLVLVLLVVNAFFVGAEFSLISSRRDRLEALVASGKPRAKTVIQASEHLSMMLAGAQLGVTIASLLLGKVGEPAVAHLIEGPAEYFGLPEQFLHPLGFAIALILVTFLHIILGEMVPKNIALAGPETVAMLLVPPHLVFVKLTRPLIQAMNWIAGHTLRLFGIEQKDELDTSVDRDQLATMITESRSEGLLDAEEHARLNKALTSESRKLKEVLIPLSRVVTLSLSDGGITLGDLKSVVKETGFSRFPVVSTAGTSYIGYIHVKDVLEQMVDASTSNNNVVPRSMIRPLFTVDAAVSFDEAMRIMRRNNAHMAQVREHGALIGVVTLEDLIEEYVGTVKDWTHSAL